MQTRVCVGSRGFCEVPGFGLGRALVNNPAQFGDEEGNCCGKHFHLRIGGNIPCLQGLLSICYMTEALCLDCYVMKRLLIVITTCLINAMGNETSRHKYIL